MTRIKVLVLHGDEAVRNRVISHLQSQGSLDTRHFAGGRDARPACRGVLPDIVIVDTSGLDVATSELIERLRPSVPRQRLVLTSAAAGSHAGPLRHGPDAVLWSPFNRWEFQQAVLDQVAALGEISRAS